MVHEILKTKIQPPPLGRRLLRRPRLTESVRAGEIAPLTLISAPAGFGKSTCAQEIAAEFPGRIAWLAIDGDDNEALRFFTYFVAAIRNVVPELSDQSQRALESSSAPAIRSVLTILVNELTEIGESVGIILDDLHLISDSSIHRELEYLISHLPPHVVVIVATRSDPPFNLARLRVNGSIRDIGPAELRFSRPEIESFIRSRSEARLDTGQIDLLAERTDGWVAGLQMAAISIDRSSDLTTFLRSFGGMHRHVVDYLTAEVLSTQPESIQRFLIRCSILSRMTGELCDALQGDSDLPGKETLAYLEEANLFVIALDEHRRWFRFHPLFADLLRARLEGDATLLHERAAQWFLDHEIYRDALTHAVASRLPRLIGRAIDGGGTPLYAHGPAGPLLDLLEGLPDAAHDAMLWIHQAWATWTAYRSDEVPPLLDRAAPSDDRRVVAHLHAIRANLAANDYDIDAMTEHASRALELLRDDEPYPRAAAYRALAVAADFSDDRTLAVHAYREAIELSRTARCTHLRIVSLTGLGMVQERNLDLHDAEQSFEEVLHLAGDPNQPVTCVAHAGLGRIAYLRNDLATAEERLTAGRDLARTIQGIDSHIGSDLFLCRVLAAKAERDRAIRELQRIEREIDLDGYHGRDGELLSLKVRLVVAGALDASEFDLESTDATNCLAPHDRVRLHIARKECATALRILDDLESRDGDNVPALILRAAALGCDGSEDAALRELRAAWKVLEPHGAVRMVLDEGPVARDLLAALTGQEVLTRRENEVLGLIAEGLSNDEIAEKLFISLSMVKGHTSRIYEKLAVRRRSEAVAEAQRRGYLA